MGVFLHGGSVGQTGVGSSTVDFERWLIWLWRWSISPLWELNEGNLEGGLPCWGP